MTTPARPPSDPEVAVPPELARLDPEAARRSAQRLGELSRAVEAACAVGERTVGELSRGWSATAPRSGVSRLLAAAHETAVLLASQGRAVDEACLAIERVLSDAQQEVLLARAELRAAAVRSAGHWNFLIGAAEAMRVHQVAAIVGDFRASMERLVRTVESAGLSLRAALGTDPTVVPDGLRAGPHAVLPPDPVMNPAHRVDALNRSQLAADLHSSDPSRIKFAMSIVQSLRQAGDRSGSAELVVYDPTAFSGQGRAAISVGDLTTATKVAVLVPGIGNSPSAMSGGIKLAGDLRAEAMRQAPQDPTAVVAWYGYDIPLSWSKDPAGSVATDVVDTVAAGTAANARAGAVMLATDLQAVSAMSQTSDRTTLLGFSMGATTVSEAGRYRLPVDAMVLLGSPGAGWDTASAAGYRNVRPSDVYVLSYDQDPVTLPVTDRLAARVTGFRDPYGPDPASEQFGGNHLAAASNVPLVAGTGLRPDLLRIFGDPAHHTMNNYMQGAALVAEGSIVVGRRTAVPTKKGR